jgi:hypothetical protein
VAETICNRRASTFYFSKDAFDRFSEAVLLDAIAESFSARSTDKIVGGVDEKHGIGDVVFLG